VTYTFSDVSLIVSGGGGGVDKAAEDVAREFTGRAALVFQADWNAYGRAAGPKRNALIAQKADALLLVWNERSPGSADVKTRFDKVYKPVLQIIVDEV
jgi:hypothetical protein